MGILGNALGSTRTGSSVEGRTCAEPAMAVQAAPGTATEKAGRTGKVESTAQEVGSAPA